jgi:hypothetical protein
MRVSLSKSVLAAAVMVSAMAAPAFAQAPDGPVYHQFVGGFVSAKGERAAILGYSDGLEVWAWPLQLASDVEIRFHVAGTVEPIAAAPLLRDVERTPTQVVRTYLGADFRVRERLFVPRQQAGALISFEVEGRPDITVEVRFKPSLDLMWPGALGGQEIGWNAARSGYVETEPLHHFSATIASPQAIAHDAIVNRARALSDHVTMLLRPIGDPNGARTATLAFALDGPGGSDGAAGLLATSDATMADARQHAAGVLADALRIETPDAAVNAALQSATLALDQAWACNDRLGCGELAGFGPSRRDRRPQYAWFFAGDGLIAAQGMIDTGQLDRARRELEFVTRWQDPASGMIWHEMSQSAGLIDWARYPYMYVHVDITFQYLAQVAAYVKASGDTGFVRDHWPAIARAWRYCRSTIDRGDGLPRIPPGKEGQDEQQPLRDDIRLSSAWVAAADGMVDLARAGGHADVARDAQAAAARARASIATLDWDPARDFWLEGHTLAGDRVHAARADAIGTIDQGIFSAQQNETLLNRLAAPDFVTDWGMRSMSSKDPAYDPNAYALGSVWALGTSGAALVFWHHHRADLAWRLWRGLVDWNTQDSAGHLHEVMAGDLFHPEMESVPEQTWSSAGLLDAAVHGLLGLDVDAQKRQITFAPQLPHQWAHLKLSNVRVGQSVVALTLDRTDTGTSLTIDNTGLPVTVQFDPGDGVSAPQSVQAPAGQVVVRRTR